MTNATRALNASQGAAGAGHQRQNFQTIGCAVPCPTRCLPKHHMAATSRTSPEHEFPWEKKTETLLHVSEACCFVFRGCHQICVWLAWLGRGPPGRSFASALCSAEPCGSVVQLTAGDEACGRGQASAPALLDVSSLVTHQGGSAFP